MISTVTASEKDVTSFKELYDTSFLPIARWVSKMGGSFDDARDIFHDSLLCLHEKRMSGALNIQGSQTAYLLGIAKHLWMRKYGAAAGLVSLNGFEEEISVPTEQVHPDSEKLLKFLSVAGKKCLDLLKSFYYDGDQLAKITSAFGFSSTRSAAEQKYKCLEKVRGAIQKKSMSYENFLE